ncbi:AcrR family transcriptional regulator [Crossiella equi]|uniref:AcrR family transcriptional regulator n=1 Tax=Crossiella equi TaxID=130796 RepID=A0ABS5ASE8_9PSEU|nr:TetR/AcrR family transcriptional regulator [Crossiella equi]MBP2478615.1 AcrR family transcriptional regulator [Crossiella equi]
MTAHTVDWTALRGLAPDSSRAAGLRERRKQETRQQLVETATTMFLDRGFDAVTVVEIAKACAVSPTTVFNYFPTKESLVLDLPETFLATLRAAFADPGRTPLRAMLDILAGELDHLVSWLTAQPDQEWGARAVQRFEAMVRDTPALRAHHRDLLHRMTTAATEELARRSGLAVHDPEPRITAAALLALWPVQVEATCRLLDGCRTPSQVRDAVTAEVHRAAAVLAGGLS